VWAGKPAEGCRDRRLNLKKNNIEAYQKELDGNTKRARKSYENKQKEALGDNVKVGKR